MNSRIRLFGAISALLLGSSPLLASGTSETGNADGALPTFVRPEQDAKACWRTQTSAAQLAAEPHRRAQSVALSMQTQISPPDEDWPEGRTLYNYELAIIFADGRSGRALGNCLPHGADAISCSVECDGGGALVTHAERGSVNVDFSAFSGIRLNYCGEAGEALWFQPTAEERRFVLQQRPESECPAVTMPDWDAGID